MTNLITLENAAVQLTLTDLSGQAHAVEVRGTAERIFEDATDTPPSSLVVFDLIGPADLVVPSRVQLELASGELTELELVYGQALTGERAFYLAVARGALASS